MAASAGAVPGRARALQRGGRQPQPQGHRRLFGGLQGDAGNDFLAGGQGFDTYVWNAGDGFDNLVDSDGSGQILYKGRLLSGGLQIGPNTYEDGAGTRYTLVGQTLLIDNALSLSGF